MPDNRVVHLAKINRYYEAGQITSAEKDECIAEVEELYPTKDDQ